MLFKDIYTTDNTYARENHNRRQQNVILISGTNSIVGMRKMFVIDNMRKQGYVLNEEILRHENCDGFLSLTCQLVFIKKSTL